MTRRLWTLMLAIGGLTVLGAYAYVHFRSPLQPVPGAPAPVARPAGSVGGGPPGGFAVPVEVAMVVGESVRDEATAVGTLRSNESVTVRPEVSGRIAQINFTEGGRVEKGAVMVALDASVQQAELQQARASLALNQQNLKRTEQLLAERFISQSALDQAVANLKVSEANVQLAEAKLSKTRIQAPFAGVIGIRRVSVGEYIKEGQDLVTLEDTSALKVDFRVPEIFLARVEKNQSLSVASDALPGVSYPATVYAIDPVVDENGRALYLRALLKNTDGRLRPGMFVRVRLVLAERNEALVVPEEAIVPGGNEQFVFKVVDGKAARVRVETGVRRGGKVEIRGGLARGDTIVTAGQIKLRDGVAVATGGPKPPSGTPTAADPPQTTSPAKALPAGSPSQAAKGA